jgi:hypothetical protein
MATVASVYSVDPHVRTPEDIVQALFHDPQAERPDPPRARPRPCHKRVRACLNYTDSGGEELLARPIMFGWMADEVEARNPDGAKPVVCIMDGQEELWAEIDLFQAASARVEILDLLHVTPRLWKAARVFTSGQREATSFVRSRLHSILCGKVKGVVRGLKRMASHRKLMGAERKTIAVVCGYLSKNCERMRYHDYLAQGYPIASGVIEGACRHVVKDRLERTGMNCRAIASKPVLIFTCPVAETSEHAKDFSVDVCIAILTEVVHGADWGRGNSGKIFQTYRPTEGADQAAQVGGHGHHRSVCGHLRCQ